ncbi:MAG: DUF2312 domain-containing protein [Hyphomicrobiales bacterium]|nr:DUF2312 domain-containing protein [Hyphomicrobiales bacterium]
MVDEPTGIAREQLRGYVTRIEKLEEEKATIAEDLKQVYAEAKALGFDTKTLRTVIRIRKQDQNERREQEAMLDLYLHALGMADEPSAVAPEERERGVSAA